MTTTQGDSGGKYRPGAYPHADDAEMFGQLYMRFVEARNFSKRLPPEDRGSDIEDEFQAAYYWALEKAELDNRFRDFIKGWKNEKGDIIPLSPAEMNLILARMKGVLERNFMYGWRDVPEDWPEAPPPKEDGAPVPEDVIEGVGIQPQRQ